MRIFFLFLFCFITCSRLWAQACSNPGQTPATAFPVCGTSVFTQANVPLCNGRTMPSPACAADQVADVNPYYYKFTCFEAGNLGFSILPKTLSDDYDWEVYDITGHDPADIYTDGSLVIASNWSGNGGETGAGLQGTNLHNCAGYDYPTWSSMPELKKGHNYLLMISHFTQSQSGYDLAFRGGTAVITDSTPPALKSASVFCSGQAVRLMLNKKLRCNTIAADGSDFVIMPGNIAVTASTAVQCNNGFDADSIQLTLSQVLSPGTYQVQAKTGSDGNTLYDFCDNAVPIGDAVSFTVQPALPTTLDSLAPVGCAPQSLQIVFKKPVYCSTVAPDGSDFLITGPYAVNILAAAGNCNNDLSPTITLQLDRPLTTAGNFVLALRQNPGGGSIVDECGFAIPPGTIDFSVADTVNAAFTYAIQYGCDQDVVQFNHPGGNGITMWSWTLDDGQTATQPAATGYYTVFDTKQVSLTVSNGVCSDSVTATVALENFLSVDFSAFSEECPAEPVQFTSAAVGQGLQHSWVFGDGGTSAEASPVHRFAAPLRTTTYNVQYSVTDSYGCTKTATKPITIYSSCTIYVPNAFTPDGDGRNDVFRPLNVVKVDQYELVIFNRWGQEIFRTKDAAKGWNGKVGGIEQGTGTYIWMMSYTDKNSKKAFNRKGSVVLIR